MPLFMCNHLVIHSSTQGFLITSLFHHLWIKLLHTSISRCLCEHKFSMTTSYQDTILKFQKFSQCLPSGYTKIRDQNLLLSLQLYGYFVVLVFWISMCSRSSVLIKTPLITYNVESVWYTYCDLYIFLNEVFVLCSFFTVAHLYILWSFVGCHVLCIELHHH